MNEDTYKNREIDEMFQRIEKALERIEGQTAKTNGRVTKLEMWRSYIAGVVSVLVLLILPILAWAIFTLVNINHQIHNAIDEALSAYEIENN